MNNHGYVVNRNIKRIMTEKHFVGRKIDRRIGWGVGTTARIATRKRRVYADEVVPIAAALQVKIDDLFRQAEVG